MLLKSNAWRWGKIVESDSVVINRTVTEVKRLTDDNACMIGFAKRWLEIFTNCHRLRLENICFVGFEKKKKERKEGGKKKARELDGTDDV